jgi:hypothetical protein
MHAFGHDIPDGVLVIVPLTGGSVNTVTSNVCTLNVAVTDSAAFIVTMQLPTPVQAPLQPANVNPAFATCVNVTVCPPLKSARHVLGHNIPDGVLVTVPLPVPALITVSA